MCWMIYNNRSYFVYKKILALYRYGVDEAYKLIYIFENNLLRSY